MLVGELRDKIEIWSGITTKSSKGSPILTFSKYKECFATVIVNRINNTFSDGINVTYNYSFYVRYDKNINYKCKIKFLDDFYEILTIQRIGRNEAQSITTNRIENNNG